MINPWLLLVLTILTEVLGIYFQKLSNGYEKVLPTIFMAACFLFTIWGTGLVMKHIEVGITMAIWAGSATALAAVLGVIVFHEDMTSFKIIGILCVVAGVVFLNLASKTS